MDIAGISAAVLFATKEAGDRTGEGLPGSPGDQGGISPGEFPLLQRGKVVFVGISR